MAKRVKIPGRLESAETGNIVTGADAVMDDAMGKTQVVINSEVDAAIINLAQGKQNVLTFDNAPTEDSPNPVTSAGVYTADKVLSDAIEAILLLIPSAASALNKLVDMQTMNSSIATATASFKGTYNLVSDLHLGVDATHEQIGAALDALSLGADNNDYAFVQVPNSATAPTEISKTERYKYNGTNWLFEYDLNNSGFTQGQWNAINSGVTSLLVGKLSDLPTNAELTTMLAGKQDSLTFDNVPTAGSPNPVKSGGVYARNNEIVALINALDVAKQDVLTFDNAPVEGSPNPVKSGGVYTGISAVQAAIVALDAAKQNVLTFDSTPTLGSPNPVTSSGIKTELNRIDGNITMLNDLYEALTQSALVIVEPTDTWPVASPATKTIYRVVDRVNTPPQYYSDYMWNGTAMVLMATYDNAIDDVPTAQSDNLVKSGGVYAGITELNNKIIDISGGEVTLVGTFLRKRVTTGGAVIDSPTDYGSISYDLSGVTGTINVSTPLNNQYIRTWALLDASDNVLGYGDLSSVKNEDAIMLDNYQNYSKILVCCQDNQKGDVRATYTEDGVIPSMITEIGDINKTIEGEGTSLSGAFTSKYINAYGVYVDASSPYGSMLYDISGNDSIINIYSPLRNQYIRTWGLLKNGNVIAYGDLSNVKYEDSVNLSLYNADTLVVGCESTTQAQVSVKAMNSGIKPEIEKLEDYIFYNKKQLQKRGDMAVNDKWVLENNNINTFKSIAFSGVIENFSYITLGHGKDNIYGSYISISETNLVVHNYVTEDVSVTYPHGLNIHDNIQVYIEREISASAKVRIVSGGDSFEQVVGWRGDHGDIWVQSFSTLTKCTFGWTCAKYKSDIFLFGDSYFDPVLDRRWLYYLMQDGYTDVLVDAFPGRNSAQAYPSFINALSHGKPRYVVWCLGMNDPDSADAINSSWLQYFEMVKNTCKSKGIEMIAITCPSCANAAGTEMTLVNTYKNNYVRNCGLRYIDFSHAVVEDETTGVWFDGMPLEPGEIHPSVKGAKSLYQQAIADFPELMMQD